MLHRQKVVSRHLQHQHLTHSSPKFKNFQPILHPLTSNPFIHHIFTFTSHLLHTYFTHSQEMVAHDQNATQIASERHTDGHIRSLEKLTWPVMMIALEECKIWQWFDHWCAQKRPSVIRWPGSPQWSKSSPLEFHWQMPIAERRCNAISIWMESKMFPMALACFLASIWDILLSMWTHMTSWRLTSLLVVIPLSTKIREQDNPIVNAIPKFPGLKRILRQPPEAVMCRLRQV